MMGLNAHPNDLTPGTLHHIIFLGDAEEGKESPSEWCRFDQWERMLLDEFGGEWAWYAFFKTADGKKVMLDVDMVTGKNRQIRNLWLVLERNHPVETWVAGIRERG